MDQNNNGERQPTSSNTSNSSAAREGVGSGAVSPFSTAFSLGAASVSTLGIGTTISAIVPGDDNASESGSSSVGIQSSSSTHTGKRSLVRRAQEFDRLLESQQHQLSNYYDDTPSRQETEDDGLQSELQELARSENLLRKELEIFTSSFRRNNNSPDEHDNNEDTDMDDASTLPDYEEPMSMIRITEAQSSSSSPLSRSSPRNTKSTSVTPGMAPWTPTSPIADAASTPRVSIEPREDRRLDLPTLNHLRQQRLLQIASPNTPVSPLQGPIQSVPSDEEEAGEDRRPSPPTMLFPTGLTSGTSVNLSPPPRRPRETDVVLSPTRVSLDNEVPSSLLQPSYLPPSASPRATPPQRPTPLLGGDGITSQSSEESSLFGDLTRLSSTTPRVSNVKGKAGEPLYVPSPSSETLSAIGDPRHVPTDTHNPSPSGTISTGLWSQPTSPSIVPIFSLSSAFGSSPVTPAHGNNAVSPLSQDASVQSGFSAGGGHTFTHTPVAASTPRPEPDDHIALLDDYIGSSWKIQADQPPPTLYPSKTSPYISVSDGDDDDHEIASLSAVRRSGRNGGKKRRLSFLAGILPTRRPRTPPLVRINTSMDSIDPSQPPHRRRRSAKRWAILALLVIIGVSLVAVPTSVLATRDRRSASASVGFGGTNASATVAPSVAWVPDSLPSPLPTLRPTISLPPTTIPTTAPSTNPTISPRPTNTFSPSSFPSNTPLPSTLQPSNSPSSSPSSLPSTIPTSRPSYSPSSLPTVRPTQLPTVRPTSNPIQIPTEIPSFLPSTMLPTNAPTTLNPTILTAQPISAPSSEPSVSTMPSSGLLDDLTLSGLIRSVSFDGGKALADVNSPQYLAFTWLSNDPNLPEYSNERRIQRYAMATIYYSLNGDSWLRNENWLSERGECDWFSWVARNVCAPTGRRLRVVSDRFFTLRRLVIYYNNLQGTLPPEIGLLTDLEEIHLMGGPQNFITGTLPKELSNLKALSEVQIANNNLTGTIPSEYRDWRNIEYLDLSNNLLQGPLPDELIDGWSRLNELNLSSNLLAGRLPNSWYPSLEFLDLDNNGFSGPIPESIGTLKNLRLLSLENNDFTSLPNSLVDLQSLEELSIARNRLQGPIISELGSLPRLRSLLLSNNLLTSSIPTELGQLGQLVTVLDLSYNNLTGEIPNEIGEVNDRLQSLNLAGNRLSGTIPKSLSALDRLSKVRLEDNDLTGNVPDAVCRVWSRTFPAVFVDCEEVSCPCCNYCCTDGQGCKCRYADDPNQAWRCV